MGVFLTEHDVTVLLMWIWMFWSFFWQPVSYQASGLIPLFLLPMAGVLASQDVCKRYFNDITGLFFIGSMIHLLLNNCGVDRRVALWFLSSGDSRQFSGSRLVYKASTAAFLLSVFSNKFIVTSNMIDILAEPLTTQQKKSKDTNYGELRYIVNNAIQTSSSIGSICIIHGSYTTLFFRGMWFESAPVGTEYPDIFNYLQYSCYVVPTALVMYLLNTLYHMLLISRNTGAAMSESAMGEVMKSLQTQKAALPKNIGSHEQLGIFFTIIALCTFIFRWCVWLNMGWSTFRREAISPDIPGIKDASVAAFYFLVLHMLPKTLGFLKYFSAERKSQIMPLKPESSILFWRFVNKHTNYGYFFLLGAGCSLNVAIRDTGLGKTLSAGIGHTITNRPWCLSLLLVVLITSILSNVMNGVAASCLFFPFVVNMAQEPDAPVPWPKKVYIGALGVGMASSLTFMFPFLYTPAYFCHKTGQVPMVKMAKYSIFSVILCALVIWLSLCFWAPVVWDPSGQGIAPVLSPNIKGVLTTPGGPTEEPTPPPDAI